jgi:uncharacterized metal-binding protein
MRLIARPLPLVYCCSGSSSAGQLANHVAHALDRQGIAEMASIAGVGAHDPQHLGKAKSRFPLIVIDGCPNACARRCLARHAIEPERHYVLSTFGATKRIRAEFSAREAERVLHALVADLDRPSREVAA